MGFWGLSTSTAIKAWVRFDGVTAAIFSSFNVAGVTKLGSGLYQIDFSQPMIDANYVAIVSGTFLGFLVVEAEVQSNSQIIINSRNSGAFGTDMTEIHALILR